MQQAAISSNPLLSELIDKFKPDLRHYFSVYIIEDSEVGKIGQFAILTAGKPMATIICNKFNATTKYLPFWHLWKGCPVKLIRNGSGMQSKFELEVPVIGSKPHPVRSFPATMSSEDVEKEKKATMDMLLHKMKDPMDALKAGVLTPEEENYIRSIYQQQEAQAKIIQKHVPQIGSGEDVDLNFDFDMSGVIDAEFEGVNDEPTPPVDSADDSTELTDDFMDLG